MPRRTQQRRVVYRRSQMEGYVEVYQEGQRPKTIKFAETRMSSSVAAPTSAGRSSTEEAPPAAASAQAFSSASSLTERLETPSLLIFACSPRALQRLEVDNEVDAAESLFSGRNWPVHRTGGTAEQRAQERFEHPPRLSGLHTSLRPRCLPFLHLSAVRRALLAHSPTYFLFCGHADVSLGSSRTLAFRNANGDLSIANPKALGEMFKTQSEGDRPVQLAFLNGCSSLQLGWRLHEHGSVETVVCWASPVDDEAATLFSQAYLHALNTRYRSSAANHADHRVAFKQAKSKVELHTRPGLLPSGKACKGVPKYVLCDPRQPDDDQGGYSPAPEPAGVPVLLQFGREFR